MIRSSIERIRAFVFGSSHMYNLEVVEYKGFYLPNLSSIKFLNYYPVEQVLVVSVDLDRELSSF